MKILVTGGAGFIGSHIVDGYLEKGHQVVVVDNLSSGKRDQVPAQARFIEMDILDPRMETVFQEENIEVINHHAAQISVNRSVADPEYDANINILGSLKLMKLAEKYGVERFIFASTGGAIYGEQEYYPACENHPCRPLSPYGIAKLCVESYLDFYRKNFNLKSTILRYSNVYGPRQDPHGEAGVVAIFCKKLLDNQVPIIYGDGAQTRDFISVFDVARASVRALEASLDGIFNIGTGEETTVNELSKVLIDRSGLSIEACHDAPRKGEQRRSVIDSRKFQKIAGWEPTQSLDEGLVTTFNYFAKEKA